MGKALAHSGSARNFRRLSNVIRQFSPQFLCMVTSFIMHKNHVTLSGFDIDSLGPTHLPGQRTLVSATCLPETAKSRGYRPSSP